MTFRGIASRLLFTASVVALPLTAGGCGRQACFTWTQAEGMCPAQADALAFFSSPDCPGKVLSVESEGVSEQDGSLCCYAVIESEADDPGCGGAGGEGFGGSTGFAVATGSGGFGGSGQGGFGGSGQGGFGGSGQGGSGGSGQGGSTACARCEAGLDTSNSTPLCPGTAELVNAVFLCACGSDGHCAEACADSFCGIDMPSVTCTACMQDPVAGCANELVACASDL